INNTDASLFLSVCFSLILTEQRHQLIRQIPLEHICQETDSPVLGLDKHVRNEPSNIVQSCRYITDIKGLSPQTAQLVTTQNAYRLFPKADRH
uniref:TatD DNase domain containing 3 n=1 Tax=Monopterus albus TaxID=43700 RepID=A0A3Q3IL75_MONAL